jgi:hypothetical protein
MEWKEYFKEKSGMGFLATSNSKGDVDVAVYSRPTVMDDGTLGYGMADRLTHANLQENPHAVYAFNEGGFQGVRLFLEKVREETEGPLLDSIREEADRVVGPGIGDLVKFVVYFRVTKQLPLVGG